MKWLIIILLVVFIIMFFNSKMFNQIHTQNVYDNSNDINLVMLPKPNAIQLTTHITV